MVSQEDIERLRELLARPAQNIVIVSHTNPDGDAVGSSLAWREALLEMGHRVTCIVPNKYPYFLVFCPTSTTSSPIPRKALTTASLAEAVPEETMTYSRGRSSAYPRRSAPR